jgi:hypothetical protein
MSYEKLIYKLRRFVLQEYGPGVLNQVSIAYTPSSATHLATHPLMEKVDVTLHFEFPVNFEFEVEKTKKALEVMKAQVSQVALTMQAATKAFQGTKLPFSGFSVIPDLEKLFPALKTAKPLCPVCAGVHVSLADAIVHLNDHHQWPRERIADWLETLDIDLSLPLQKEVQK